MDTISDRLRFAREWKGWKQSQLAVAADVSTGTIGNIEAKIRKSKGSIPQIAKALGVSYEWLAYGTGEMLPATVAATLTAPPTTLQARASNHHIDTSSQAKLAITKAASLYQLIDGLLIQLGQVDPSKRAAIAATLAVLATDPTSPGMKDALVNMLAPSEFAETQKKAA